MPNKELPCDEPGSLLLRTRKLLRSDPRSLIDIHKESDLPFFWLLEFKRERTDGANVNRVQALYEFLSAKKLKF